MKVGGFNYKSTCYVLAQRSKVWTPQLVAGGGLGAAGDFWGVLLLVAVLGGSLFCGRSEG